MLNAELKSMNSILRYESFLSRCVRAGWMAVAMASSLMCCMTSHSKHFMRIGVSATGR